MDAENIHGVSDDITLRVNAIANNFLLPLALYLTNTAQVENFPSLSFLMEFQTGYPKIILMCVNVRRTNKKSLSRLFDILSCSCE